MTATILFTQSQIGAPQGAPSQQQSATSGTPYIAKPLVILHGLFGNWENWGARIRQYASHSDVHAMDLRNHGESPHLPSMSYTEMAEDVIKTLDHLAIDSFDLLGHSMGGKVAMQVASQHSARVTRLILVDIAPKPYPPHHQSIIDALCSIDTAKLTSRKDADRQLVEAVDDAATRAFLLKNLVREASQSGFRWQFNLAGIRDSYPQLMRAPELGAPYYGPTLFIKGAESDYLQDDDRNLVMQAFPNAKLKVIGGAGHWPHAEKAGLFDRILGQFLGFS